MKKTLIILICLAGFICKAQPGKEAWHWRFGKMGGLDFSSGQPLPEAGIPAQWYFPAGCASISDPVTGQFLFSTSGNKIFNRNNTVMTNGYIMGPAVSKSDQHLIVPRPGDPTVFHVFSTLWGSSINPGIYHHEVDMQQQNGLGAVTISYKLLINGPATSRITAVRHCNGLDYWVIGHKANSDTFCVFKVTSAGVDTIPVVSVLGVVVPYVPWNSQVQVNGLGLIKASPNGKMLAVSVESAPLPVLELYDFDNSSGIISNSNTITYPGKRGPYGVSFSPDSRKLYAIPSTYVRDTSFLYQYDVSGGNTSAVAATETLVAKVARSYGNNTGGLLDLQIGPDGRIYMPRAGGDTIAAIIDPNNSGLTCNFTLSAFKIPGGYVGTAGLPNLILSEHTGMQLNVPDIQLCSTFTTSVADAGPGFASYQWSTGATTQTISISSPGQYWVTVTSDQGCQRTDTIGAYVLIPIKEDTVACDTFHVNVTQGGVLQYNWYDGNQIPIRDFTVSGNYFVDINYVNGCGIRDSFDVTIVPSPQIDIGPDTTFCKGNLILTAFNPTSTYTWSTGSSASSIVATQAADYWVLIKDANGCTDSDTLVINPDPIAFSFKMPNIVTPNGDRINDEIDFGKLQLSEFKIAIFNRWGQQVFASESVDGIWKPNVEDGTYFYTAQYRIDCGVDTKAQSINGFITVIK